MKRLLILLTVLLLPLAGGAKTVHKPVHQAVVAPVAIPPPIQPSATPFNENEIIDEAEAELAELQGQLDVALAKSKAALQATDDANSQLTDSKAKEAVLAQEIVKETKAFNDQIIEDQKLKIDNKELSTKLAFWHKLVWGIGGVIGLYIGVLVLKAYTKTVI